jgi:hypothetical protein
MVKENCVINPLTNRAILINSPTYEKIKHLLPKSKTEDKEQKTPQKKSSYKTPPLASTKTKYMTPPLASTKSKYGTPPLASSRSKYRTASLASSKSSYKTPPLASTKSKYGTPPLASSRSKYRTASLASSKSSYKTPPLASTRSKYGTPPLASSRSKYRTASLASSKSSYKTPPLASTRSKYGTPPLASTRSKYGTPPLASTRSKYGTPPLASTRSKYGTPPLASTRSKYGTPPLASTRSKYGTPPLASTRSKYGTPPLASTRSKYGTPPLASTRSKYGTPPLASTRTKYMTPPLASTRSKYGTPPLGTSPKKRIVPLIDNIKIIQKFLKKKLIKDRYSLKNRIAFTKYVENKIKSIPSNECAKPYTFPDGTKGYTINNIIYLNKIIGTPSVYGKIYLSTIKNSFGGFAMVAKMMQDSKTNLNEIALMHNITNKLIASGISKHFIINVGSFHCMNKKEKNRNNKLLAINELAHGDLSIMVNDQNMYRDERLLINVFLQIYIAIATFQIHTKYVHRDCHWGNFLYQRNNDVGWYKYIFDDNTFYLKACGYNMAIYDFGLSKKIKDEDIKKANSMLFDDYFKIIHAFIPERNRGWNKNTMPPLVNESMTNLRDYLNSHAVIGKVVNKGFKNQVDLFHFIYENVFRQFINDFNDIITDVKPTGKIINEENPFIIN